MKIIPVLLLAIFLQGCTAPRKRIPTIVEPTKVVQLAPESIQPCELLKEDVVIKGFDEALVVYSDLANAYGVCAKKQLNSIRLLKEFGNIK